MTFKILPKALAAVLTTAAMATFLPTGEPLAQTSDASAKLRSPAKLVPDEVENPPQPVMRAVAPDDVAIGEPENEDVGDHSRARSVPCPDPVALNLVGAAPSNTSPFAADFPPQPAAQWIEPKFGGNTADRHVRHSFQFQQFCAAQKCCQVTRGVLRVRVKALQGGSSNQSPDAGNDSISIWKNGTVVHWQYLHSSFPVTPGTVKTINIPIRPSWLDGCRLSFQVQDDHSVEEARLILRGCCVTPNVKR
ncbi:MAG: hypothetical protein NZ533_02760 [Casimicrobiaceae bacterium]|nr:hypothetical protein [Casimicrobiaceae bacterium]MCX8097649.1 hypothetical protein [Casimicrobiaceae bacterium]MDW8311841.1 hypothetical protein [Burkholderiales bacterium]